MYKKNVDYNVKLFYEWQLNSEIVIGLDGGLTKEIISEASDILLQQLTKLMGQKI